MLLLICKFNKFYSKPYNPTKQKMIKKALSFKYQKHHRPISQKTETLFGFLQGGAPKCPLTSKSYGKYILSIRKQKKKKKPPRLRLSPVSWFMLVATKRSRPIWNIRNKCIFLDTDSFRACLL